MRHARLTLDVCATIVPPTSSLPSSRAEGLSLDSPELRIGTRLDGKYELLRICGRGGMGVLFEGEHVWTGRRVAVKLLHHQGSRSDGESLSRFLQEARTAAALRHPNVVDILDMGADGTSPFLVMELLEGESLESLLARQTKLSPAECLTVLLPVMGAVATAHDAGIVHRDLKPANIFLSRDPSGTVVPKLVDFGIARGAQTGKGRIEDLVLGTPSYMSPEQARGEPVGPEADVWALGVVLYRCLAGVLPFTGDSAALVLASVLAGRHEPLTSIDRTLPARLCAAVERALSSEPMARYADTRSFARALIVTAAASGIEAKGASEIVGLVGGVPRSSSAPDGAAAPPETAGGSTTVEQAVVGAGGPPGDPGTTDMAVESQPPRGHGRRTAPVFVGLSLLCAVGLATYVLGVRDERPRSSVAGSNVPAAASLGPTVTETPASAAGSAAPAPRDPERAPPDVASAAPPESAAPPASRSAHSLSEPTPRAAGSAARRKAEPGASPLERRGRSVPKIRTEW